ncbi:MAG: hypothetical protein ACK48P_01820 [Holosporales bacterium]
MTNPIATAMAAELGLPLRHIKKHFDRITARFANVDRVDPQRIMVCELRACMDAWYSGNTSQPNADSLKDRPRTAKDWQELFTFLNNLPQIMQKKYPNNNPLAGLSIDENNKLDPKDIEFMALTYGGADTNDEETRQKLAKIHFKPFQEILRADTNREILAVDQENDAVHSVKVFLDQLCDLCWCTPETQTVFADHYHTLLLGTWGHDFQDEFPGELGTAGDQYTKNGAAKPEIHLDATEAYWKLLKTTTGASLTEKTEKRLFPLLKAYDRWKKTETEIVRQLASTLGIKTKSLREILGEFNNLSQDAQSSLLTDAVQKAIGTILNNTDTNRVDLGLALIIKIADRRHNQDEHTITGLLRHFWCPPHKMPQAFNDALLDTINQGTPEDAKAGERISSAANATSKANSERPIRHPSNPTAWIEASPETIPLLDNYLSQVVDNAVTVLGGLKDQKQRTAFLHLFRVMRDSVERIEDRVASTQEKRDHLFDWGYIAENLTTAGIIVQAAGIVGTIGNKIEPVSTALTNLLPTQDISHLSQQLQSAGTLGTLWPMLQNAFKDRSCMQLAATAWDAAILGQILLTPEKLQALIPLLLFGNAVFMFGRMRDQLIPADRRNVAKITDIPAAAKDEWERSLLFIGKSLEHFPEDIKILSQYLTMTLQGHVPNSDKKTEFQFNKALARVSGLMNLAQLPGGLFPNNPVYAGMRGFGELFDGIARGIEGKKNHNWFWQVSAGIMTISRLCMTASPLLGEHQQGTFDAGQLMLTASFVFFSLGLQQAVQGKDRH